MHISTKPQIGNVLLQSGGWQPLPENLRFWLDGQDVAGDGSATADSALIGTWANKVSGGTDATASGAARPTYDASEQALDFDGSSDKMTSNSYRPTFFSSAGYTVFFVLTVPSTITGRNGLMDCILNASSSGFGCEVEKVSTNFGMRVLTRGSSGTLIVSVNGTQTGNILDTDTKQVIAITADTTGSSGAPVRIYKNGSEVHSAVTLAAGSAATPSADLSIGGNVTGTLLYDGLIAECLIYEGVMSDADRNYTFDGLQDKWSIA